MGPLNHPDIHYIVIVDYYSWFYEVEVMQSTTTEKIIDCLADGFCLHGLQITIKSDNGPQLSRMNLENIVNSIVYYIRRLLPTERLRDQIVHY